MNLAIKSNGLDVKAIHPKNGAKFSPNLYCWLTARNRKSNAWTSRVYSDKDGTLWIGMLDNGDLIGARLISVLCNGAKESGACWTNLGELTEITDFWDRYVAIGRCAIDDTHTMHFIDDNTRWQINGEHRECLWCGNYKHSLRPLPPGSVIDFCGEEATVIKDSGDHKLTVNASGFEVSWYWAYDGATCTIVSVPDGH